MNPNRYRILVTNDDGIISPGINLLAQALRDEGYDVWVIAPDRERSAISHCFTMHHPIRVNQLEAQTFTIDGTPSDCVMFGARGYLDRRPDMVVSGINRGPNLGSDVIYSGTVAGAHEGHLHQIPSVALSINITKPGEEAHFETGARFAKQLTQQILEHGLPSNVFLNVNIPNIPWEALAGVTITKLGKRIYRDQIIRRIDPQGREYFWIGGEAPTWESEEGCDFYAMERNLISITPLGQDMTQKEAIPTLQSWELDLENDRRGDQAVNE